MDWRQKDKDTSTTHYVPLGTPYGLHTFSLMQTLCMRGMSPADTRGCCLGVWIGSSTGGNRIRINTRMINITRGITVSKSVTTWNPHLTNRLAYLRFLVTSRFLVTNLYTTNIYPIFVNYKDLCITYPDRTGAQLESTVIIHANFCCFPEQVTCFQGFYRLYFFISDREACT